MDLKLAGDDRKLKKDNWESKCIDTTLILGSIMYT